MKGVVLSGGSGTRLRPITNTGPKQLIPIANKPVLEYVIEDLVEVGITDIAVILGNKGREAIRTQLGDGGRFGADIEYIVQGDPKGIAHAVGCAQKFVGESDFVVYLGDNILSGGIRRLTKRFNMTDASAGIATQTVEDPTAFGVVEYEGETVSGLVEKPQNPPSNHALIGVYCFTPAVFEQIEQLEPSWRGEYEITHAIQGIIDNGQQVVASQVEGWWKDTGTPEDVLNANKLILQQTGDDIADNAVISGDTRILGPVSIAAGVEIADSYIGPYTSIGPDSIIGDARITNSVIIGEAQITTAKPISDSLIGTGVTIDTPRRKPDDYRFVVGRDSAISLR